MLDYLSKPRKGQVSVELLIILGILTIGALIVGTYYFQTLNTNMSKERTTDFDSSRAFGKEVSCGLFDLSHIQFSPSGFTFLSSVDVTLSFAGSCAKAIDIYYTLNGTEPTTYSNVYSSPIHITQTTTVKARAFLHSDSSVYGNVVSQTYIQNN